ncbi:MAG: precorrin-6A synthase (deacetylating) [Acetobacteraceae bacterium]|nr:precorrin-6A synthase (deacetylating) [Acetobacteraceae bacterium]
MRRVLVIGIGAGDPEHVTAEAAAALNAADVLFEIERATEELTRARAAICRRYLEPGRAPRVVSITEPRRNRTARNYGEAVEAWRAARGEAWERALDKLPEDGCGAFLVWGDPSLYDSTVSILREIAAAGRVAFTIEVIPGVSSVHALTARHAIPLNRVAGAVLITTGRRLADHGFPAGVDDVVVMLDAGCAFRQLIDQPLEIYWGAYLGTQDEILLSGRLADVADQIERVRAEARERKGWIMDCYLLRRP